MEGNINYLNIFFEYLIGLVFFSMQCSLFPCGVFIHT